MNCPHCGHEWTRHNKRCADCGCMWPAPKPPEPEPSPPTYREQLIAHIENVIWAELETQAEEGMGPYVDREMDMVDASGAGVNMTAVAAAVAAIFVDSIDDCSWCHSPSAIGGWKTPEVDE
jgi:hypothetical protein